MAESSYRGAPSRNRGSRDPACLFTSLLKVVRVKRIVNLPTHIFPGLCIITGGRSQSEIYLHFLYSHHYHSCLGPSCTAPQRGTESPSLSSLNSPPGESNARLHFLLEICRQNKGHKRLHSPRGGQSSRGVPQGSNTTSPGKIEPASWVGLLWPSVRGVVRPGRWG